MASSYDEDIILTRPREVNYHTFLSGSGVVTNLTIEDAPPLSDENTLRRLTLQTACTVWTAQIILTFFQAGIKHERPLDNLLVGRWPFSFVRSSTHIQFRKESSFMSMYSIKDLLALWSQEKLTVAQAIGQVIQHLLSHFNRLNQVEKRLLALEQQAPNAKS